MKLFSGLAIVVGVGYCHGNSIRALADTTTDGALAEATEAVDALFNVTSLIDNIGDRVFNKTLLEEAAKYIDNHSSKYETLIQEDGRDALKNLEAIGTQYKQIQLGVTRMLSTVKGNTEFTKSLLDEVPSTGVLGEEQKETLLATLLMLQATLEQAEKDLHQQEVTLANVSETTGHIQSTMLILQDRFLEAKDEKSEYIDEKIMHWRAGFYSSCAATIVIPPLLVACYASAAGIIEGKVVPDIIAELTPVVNELGTFGTTFSNLATVAGALQNDTDQKMVILSNFNSRLTSTNNILKAVGKLTLVNRIVRSKFVKSLERLLTACDETQKKFEEKYNTLRLANEKASYMMLGAGGEAAEVTADNLLVHMATDQAKQISLGLYKTSTKMIKV